MQKEEITNKLGNYIASEFLKRPDRDIGVTEPLISGGLVDSFSLVDLALFVEQTWSVRIEDTELNAETFDTLDELADLIVARRG
jgi:acyl carrier protein